MPIMTVAKEVCSMKTASAFSVNIDWNELKEDDRDIGSYILGDRGWITQEWILSRRMIHYFIEDMVWIYKTTIEDESGRNLIGVTF